MFYVSPFTLLGISDVGSAILERRDLQMAKKKMLAEIELSETQTVKINEKEFSKDEILKIFEELEDEKVVEYHRLIAIDKAFILFLEKGFISDYNNIKKTPQTEDSGFVHFVSPYYRERYEPELNKLFKAQDFFNLNKLLKTNRFMNMADEEACFKKVYESVNERVEKISELSVGIRTKRLFGITVAESVFYSRNYLGAISSLPDFFMELRNRMAQALILLYVEAYNVLKRSDISGEIVRNLDGLKVDEEMRLEIIRRQKEYNDAAASANSYSAGGGTSSGSSSGVPVRAIIWGLVIIVKIFILSRACGGSSRHDYSYLNSNSFNNLHYSTNQNQETNSVEEELKNRNLIYFLDTIYSKHKSRIKKKLPIETYAAKNPENLYEDILKWNEEASSGMKDTAKVVFVNNSDFEVCVFISSSSGARAWNIPPGDSVLALSRDKMVNVYYTAGYKLEAKKKFILNDYDDKVGVYKNFNYSIRTYKNTIQDPDQHFHYPETINLKLMDDEVVKNMAKKGFLALRYLSSLQSSKLELLDVKKRIVFSSWPNESRLIFSIKDASTIKPKYSSLLTNTRTP